MKSSLPRKCVVVPFDFSEKSTQSLEWAGAFVADLADLHVVHVVSEAFGRPSSIPKTGRFSVPPRKRLN